MDGVTDTQEALDVLRRFASQYRSGAQGALLDPGAALALASAIDVWIATTRAPGEGEPVAQLGGAPDDLRNTIKICFAEYSIEKMAEVSKRILAMRDPALAAPSYAQPAPCPKCAGTKFLDKGGARAAIQRTHCPDCAQPAPRADLVTLKRRLDYRMNEHLCEMKPDFDDSITGFNEAWKIVDNLFAEATIAALAQTAPVTAQPAPRADLVERLRTLLRSVEHMLAPGNAIREAIAALSEAPREAEGWRSIDIDGAAESLAGMITDWYGAAPLPNARITPEVIAQRLRRFAVPVITSGPNDPMLIRLTPTDTSCSI